MRRGGCHLLFPHDQRGVLFFALASDQRLRIIQFLKSGGKHTYEIVNFLKLHPSVISRHLSILYDVGIVMAKRERDGYIWSIGTDSVFKLLSYASEILQEKRKEEDKFLRGGKMILAFACDDEKGLDGVVAYHFGRCPYYTFVEVKENKTKDVKVEKTSFLDSHQPGDVPNYIAQHRANAIFTGGMGPKAQDYFSSLGVKPVIGVYGRVEDVLNGYLKGNITQEAIPKEVPSKTTENEELERLKKEVQFLREKLLELKEKLKEISG
ncbi:MAG: NifB/NifX family molybdenum-iron cluster-binding protein [Campylobacterota bacterium]|nr:NifB/NifX family molybdenum-iron cluster-binding protein [Campylobacterota bacterium]